MTYEETPEGTRRCHVIHVKVTITKIHIHHRISESEQRKCTGEYSQILNISDKSDAFGAKMCDIIISPMLSV